MAHTEQVTPSPGDSSRVVIEVGELEGAKQGAALARPLAQSLLAIAKLVEYAPRLQKLVEVLEQRKRDLDERLVTLGNAVTATQHASGEAIAAETRRLEAFRAEVNQKKQTLADELTAARANHDTAKHALAQAREAAQREQAEHLEGLQQEATAAKTVHAETLAALTSELAEAIAKRDAILADLERLKVKHGLA
jgi:ABC-type transporter Mla subunit MlaD